MEIRRARPERDDGERFAAYFEVAADGLLTWMFGKRYVDVVVRAYLEPGHDLSHEYVWFAESDDGVAGMLSGYSSADHAEASDAPLFRAAGIRSVRALGAALMAARLFSFMGRLPDGDWYVQALAVDSSRRGRGVGSLLLDHAERVAVSEGSTRLALDVAIDNDDARRLYERRGMAVEDTSPSVLFEPGMAVHRMAKRL